jgi:hypothetical protein
MKIWECKIGGVESVMPGADLHMRHAISAAYRQITGREPHFIFSGWGGQLTDDELDVIDEGTQDETR